MAVRYNTRKEIWHGHKDRTDVTEDTFNLEKNGRIVKVEVRHGTLIDQLTFYTNTGKKYGPYGGNGGKAAEPPETAPYRFITPCLAWISGNVVKVENHHGLKNLQFGWKDLTSRSVSIIHVYMYFPNCTTQDRSVPNHNSYDYRNAFALFTQNSRYYFTLSQNANMLMSMQAKQVACEHIYHFW